MAGSAMRLTLKQAQKNFFNRDNVIDAVGKAKAGVMNHQGALVRKIMRQSMRARKGPSKPGEPPNAHTRLIKDFIFYSFDQATKTVVVGPVKLGGKGMGAALPTLESGGTVLDTGIVTSRGKFIPLRLMHEKGRAAALASGRVVVRQFTVEARPFAASALEKAKGRLAEMWKDKVKA